MSEATLEQEVATIETEVGTLQEQADAVVIDSPESNTSATEVLGVLTKKKKAVEEARKFFVDPLNKQVKEINAKFKPQTELLDGAISTIKGKVGAYHVEQEKKAAAEQARKDAIRAAADAKRKEEGKEAIAEPVKQVEEKPQTTKTETAAATVKKVWKHRVVSMSAMPEHVMKAILEESFKKGIVDQVVRKFVNAGIREMEGVEIYEDTVVAVR